MSKVAPIPGEGDRLIDDVLRLEDLISTTRTNAIVAAMAVAGFETVNLGDSHEHDALREFTTMVAYNAVDCGRLMAELQERIKKEAPNV